MTGGERSCEFWERQHEMNHVPVKAFLQRCATITLNLGDLERTSSIGPFGATSS